ncbi:MAG: hypothetical protein Q4E09_02975 [Eubacteriales bacterium]|nr:hypothetical protein [Eubacteriales bacterium]
MNITDAAKRRLWGNMLVLRRVYPSPEKWEQAEAYYGLPKALANKVFDYLTDDLNDVIFDFDLRLTQKEYFD